MPNRPTQQSTAPMNITHSLLGISFFTLITFRREADSEGPRDSQQKTLDLTKLLIGSGSASTTVFRNSGDYSLSLWQRSLKMVMYLPFFSIRAYSLLAMVYSLQLRCSSSSASLPESTEELSRSSASPQSSSATVLSLEQALQSTCAAREKQRLHSSSPSSILPLSSSSPTKTLATTCLSAVEEYTSAVRKILVQRCRLCSLSGRIPLRLSWQRQTRAIASSLPTQGTDLAATMPLVERLARKVWMHSVRAHQADCPRAVKRVLMAMRFTQATFSMMASRFSSQLALSSSSRNSCVRAPLRKGASSSTSSALSTIRLTRMPKRQCILQSLRANSSSLTALYITCCRTASLTARFSWRKTTMRRRKISTGSATCHTSSSVTLSSKNWRVMKSSGNSEQVRAACRRVVILLFMRAECGMAAPQSPQTASPTISHTSTRITIATSLYSQCSRRSAPPRLHCPWIASTKKSVSTSMAFTLSGVERRRSRKAKRPQKAGSETLELRPSSSKKRAGRKFFWPMQLLMQSRLCRAPISSCRCSPLRSSSIFWLSVNCSMKAQQCCRTATWKALCGERPSLSRAQKLSTQQLQVSSTADLNMPVRSAAKKNSLRPTSSFSTVPTSSSRPTLRQLKSPSTSSPLSICTRQSACWKKALSVSSPGSCAKTLGLAERWNSIMFCSAALKMVMLPSTRSTQDSISLQTAFSGMSSLCMLSRSSRRPLNSSALVQSSPSRRCSSGRQSPQKSRPRSRKASEKNWCRRMMVARAVITLRQRPACGSSLCGYCSCENSRSSTSGTLLMKYSQICSGSWYSSLPSSLLLPCAVRHSFAKWFTIETQFFLTSLMRSMNLLPLASTTSAGMAWPRGGQPMEMLSAAQMMSRTAGSFMMLCLTRQSDSLEVPITSSFTNSTSRSHSPLTYMNCGSSFCRIAAESTPRKYLQSASSGGRKALTMSFCWVCCTGPLLMLRATITQLMMSPTNSSESGWPPASSCLRRTAQSPKLLQSRSRVCVRMESTEWRRAYCRARR